MEHNRFRLVGIRPPPPPPPARLGKWYQGKPVFAAFLLGALILGCIGCPLFLSKAPAYMDLFHSSVPPCREFWFGTDAMGRDVFSMIWYGGRVSLFIGFSAAAVSAALGVAVGSASGLAPAWLDAFLMRLTEIFLSIPNLLLVMFLQAILGAPSPVTIAFVIGITSWTDIAKAVRAQVRQLRNSGYVAVSRCMGGSFFHILRKHLTPNFLSSILFMIVMNVRGAIAAESTLSFLGMGLPLETVSWGGMLALAENALLGGDWWIIVIPGVFLVGTMLSLTEIGISLRKNAPGRHSNL